VTDDVHGDAVRWLWRNRNGSRPVCAGGRQKRPAMRTNALRCMSLPPCDGLVYRLCPNLSSDFGGR